MKQQLWGSSITPTLCVWRELSPKVSNSVCVRESWDESRNWHSPPAFLGEFAIREAVLGEDWHCHVRE